MTILQIYGIMFKSSRDDTIKRFLGVAQLVARYLGVVEAASSSLVTQTRKSRTNISLFGFFYSK